MTDKANSLEDKIIDWINSQGYPLELFVARKFQEKDYTVTVSDVYEDPNTKQLREIDVTAWIIDLEQPIKLEICFRVSCKSSLSKPWILFSSNTQPERIIPFHLPCSKIASTFLLNAILDDGLRNMLGQSEMFNTPLPHCHSITQAFTTGKDITLDAIMSAVKSSVFIVEERNSPSNTLPFISFVFPVVVVDGKLFECELAANNEIKIKEVEKSIVYWKNIDGNYFSFPFVHITTKESIDDFINYLDNAAHALIECAKETMEELAESLTKD